MSAEASAPKQPGGDRADRGRYVRIPDGSAIFSKEGKEQGKVPIHRNYD